MYLSVARLGDLEWKLLGVGIFRVPVLGFRV